MISGAALHLVQGGRPDPIVLSKLSFRPGLPMQSTLYNLAEAAARTLSSGGAGETEFLGMQTDLTLLYDAAMQPLASVG